jgi:hypothetical protein
LALSPERHSRDDLVMVNKFLTIFPVGSLTDGAWAFHQAHAQAIVQLYL